MNKLKTNARILLIIIISTFIIVPITSILVSKLFGIHEGMSDYGMTGKNVKMDRINASTVSFTDNDGISRVGVSGEYLYCIGGDIICSDGSALTTSTTYTDSGGKSHNSYTTACATGSVMCNNNLSTMVDNSISFVDSDNIAMGVLTGPSDDMFKGFLGPYNNVPMDISGSYVYLSGITPGYASACNLYGDCSEDVVVAATTETATETATENTLKCLADNGAKQGDPLCCGQDGVLQDTKYNCPSEYPHCVGYKCGETWGKCSTTAQ